MTDIEDHLNDITLTRNIDSFLPAFLFFFNTFYGSPNRTSPLPEPNPNLNQPGTHFRYYGLTHTWTLLWCRSCRWCLRSSTSLRWSSRRVSESSGSGPIDRSSLSSSSLKLSTNNPSSLFKGKKSYYKINLIKTG